MGVCTIHLGHSFCGAGPGWAGSGRRHASKHRRSRKSEQTKGPESSPSNGSLGNPGAVAASGNRLGKTIGRWEASPAVSELGNCENKVRSRIHSFTLEIFYWAPTPCQEPFRALGMQQAAVAGPSILIGKSDGKQVSKSIHMRILQRVMSGGNS